MDRKQFLEELFGEKPEDHLICIFTLPDRRSAFFNDIDKADAYAETKAISKNQNIYFGTNLLGKKPSAGRGEAEDSSGAVCFYMDVDIDTVSAAHSKSDLPKSTDEAISIVKGNGFDPSIIVHSGYGLHVYWLFKEPWIFLNDKERNQYHMLLLRLQATVKAKAAKSGWRLDSTADTARVLRLPGTFNIKIPTNPIEVKVIEHSLNTIGETDRYSPDEIEVMLIDEEYVKKTVLSDKIKYAIYNDGDLILDVNASPPADKLEQLCEIEEKFAKAWKAKRHELGNDPSAYAMSLCNYAARANWTKQEMVNLIIGFYRKHLDNPLFTNRPGHEPISMQRIMRISKIAVTIGKAIQAAQEERAKQYEEEIDPAETAGMADMVDPTGERALQYLSSQLRMDVIAINRYVPEEDKDVFYEWIIKRDGHERKVTFRNVDEMLKQDSFRKRVINCINYPPRRIDKENWGKIEQSICKVSKNISVTPSTETIEGKMRSWISQYLENRPSLNILQACRGNQPFVEEGCWHLFSKPFGDWCWQNKGMTDGVSRTQINLKRVGAEEVRFNRSYPDNPKERMFFRAWRIPHGIAIPPPTLVVNNSSRQPGENLDEIEMAQTESGAGDNSCPLFDFDEHDNPSDQKLG